MSPIPSYRIGNDLPLTFLVEDTGTPMTVENTDITLYDTYGYPVHIPSWRINGREVTGTFLGKDQKRTGLYTVKVVINKGKVGMVTMDMQLFRLVPHSWQADTEPPVPSADSSEDASGDSSFGDSSEDGGSSSSSQTDSSSSNEDDGSSN